MRAGVTSRANPRWSANKKMYAVMRLLQGESCLSCLASWGCEAHPLAAWRDVDGLA